MKKIFTKKNIAYFNIFLALLITFLLLFTSINIKKINKTNLSNNPNDLNDDMISISFVGDLILLEDQVKAGYNDSHYNFNKMFSYASKYFEKTDYTIGVLEGPVANSTYSIGNFNDGKNIYLNYPKEFIDSIKGSGIDLVTISNNHILDKELKGLNETIENLKERNMDFIGSKERYKIVNIKNLKVGILAYTYGTNYYSEEKLYNLNITNMILPKTSSLFEQVKNDVINDFNELKKQNVDLIIVLPHMGSQFALKQNEMQKTWNKIFADNGASIVLGDHSHSVQPLEYINDCFIVNSPGNFANQYTDNNGDATSIVNIYIDKNTKKVINSSIIPMFTKSDEKGFYYSIPIYDILNNIDIYNSMSNDELERIKNIQKLITKVMLNKEISTFDIEEQYYFSKDGYIPNKIKKLNITNDLKKKKLYQELLHSKSVCFIGDSITAGSINGGHGWYEPLTANFDINVKKASYGSYTSKLLLKNKQNEIKNCTSDLNVIAIGANDIRYRNENSAMTSDEYINNIDEIIKLINNKKIILIAPFYSMSYDKVTNLSLKEKNKLYEEYTKALENYSKKNNYLFINPNPILEKTLNNSNTSYYLIDYIHPNHTGLYLYSEAILEASN
mgnify:FL=1